MGFSPSTKEKAFVACGRFCCLCHKYCGTKMEVHHIKPESEGGKNTFDNAIPLCFDCHSDMSDAATGHYKGNRFTQSELIKHRNNWYKAIESGMGYYAPVDIIEVVSTGSENRKNVVVGIPNLDEKSSIAPESIVVIAGKSKSGKTALAKSFALRNTESSLLYLSLKDGTKPTELNFLCNEAVLDSHLVQDGKLTEEEWQRLAIAVECLGSLQIEFDDFGLVGNTADKLLYALKTKDKDIYIVDDINALCLDEYEIERFMYKVRQIQQATKSIIVFICNVKNTYRTCDNNSISESIYRFSDYAYFINEVEDDILKNSIISLYVNHEDKEYATADVHIEHENIIMIEKSRNKDKNK